jgi:hypothetical protein
MFLPAVRIWKEQGREGQEELKGDWVQVKKNFQKLSSLKLGDRATPTFAELTLTGLTASQLLQTDSDKKLTSIALPLIVSKGGTGATTLTDHSILLGSGTSAITALGAATNGQLPIGSTGADPVLAGITGTGNQITVTNGAGTITLSLPQDYDTGASPTLGTLTLSKTCTLAAGLNVLRVTGLQTDGTAMTGTLRGAYIDVSNGSTAATGTIRGMELKARTQAPGDTGNDVTVLEGLSISADSKNHSVTTLRGAEFIIDGTTGGTITEAVGLRIANNLQANKATTSYGLQIYRDSFDYTADIQLSSGGLIGGSTGDLRILDTGYVGIGVTPSYKLSIGSTDGSDQIGIYHDNSNAYMKWNDGYLALETDEGTNTTTNVYVRGKGTGSGSFRVYDEDTEYVRFRCLAGSGYLEVRGTSPVALVLQYDGDIPIKMFSSSTEGKTQELQIYGFRTGDGVVAKSLQMGVGVDAADTASFDGVSNYWFDGTIKSTNGALLGDGGTADYTEFEADGTPKFHGAATAWNDANVGAMTLTVPVANQPDEVNFVDEVGGDTGITTWGYAIGEKSSGAIEVPHDYKEGSDITFHIHWQGIAAPSGTDYVKWQLTYTVAAANGEETLDAATTITVETAFDTQYEFKLSSFDAITGTNIQMGDQFLFTLERIAAAGDAYLGDALIATVGLHYECDTVGSRQMLSKA